MQWNRKTKIEKYFSFICKQKWAEMNATYDPTIKYCTHCQCHVHKVQTHKEFQKKALMGHCVFVQIEQENSIIAKPSLETKSDFDSDADATYKSDSSPQFIANQYLGGKPIYPIYTFLTLLIITVSMLGLLMLIFK